MSSQWDGGEDLISPHLAGCAVWLCFLQQGLGITTQHESVFTYGKVTWDLDPNERSEKEVNEWHHHLIRKPSLLELHDISLFSIQKCMSDLQGQRLWYLSTRCKHLSSIHFMWAILEYVYQNIIDIFLICWS